jgi:hypothetical protein
MERYRHEEVDMCKTCTAHAKKKKPAKKKKAKKAKKK